ncbi:MAG: hypothetical protein JWN85_1138 [Gammaproteobacteria bacterium]|nr:hypothetical protein [Gammaproteobacteria bacterium]
MSKHCLPQCTLLAVVGALALSISMAEERPPDHRDREEHRGYVLDQRFHHNRYYPPHGFVVHALPRGFLTVRRPYGEFFFSDGIWYRRRGPDFLVVTPPVGLTIGTLPPGYSTVWVHGVPYYYANDVYYTQGPDGYAVVDPPSEGEIVTTPPGAPPPPAAGSAGGEAEDFFIYPKNGQSDAQQAADRYQCHRWGTTQTGFDPTQPTGGVPPQQAAQKRAEYRRAMSACLEARGYTVK